MKEIAPPPPTGKKKKKKKKKARKHYSTTQKRKTERNTTNQRRKAEQRIRPWGREAVNIVFLFFFIIIVIFMFTILCCFYSLTWVWFWIAITTCGNQVLCLGTKGENIYRSMSQTCLLLEGQGQRKTNYGIHLTMFQNSEHAITRANTNEKW